jgi:hypothetical protein
LIAHWRGSLLTIGAGVHPGDPLYTLQLTFGGFGGGTAAHTPLFQLNDPPQLGADPSAFTIGGALPVPLDVPLPPFVDFFPASSSMIIPDGSENVAGLFAEYAYALNCAGLPGSSSGSTDTKRH